MPRKIRPKYGIDPTQKVPDFSFTRAEKERLLKALNPVNGGPDEIIERLVVCARNYLWVHNQYREMPTRAQQNATLEEVGRLARDLGTGLCGLDKDTEWELMSNHPAFRTRDFIRVIPELADQLEDIADAAELALHAGQKKSGPRTHTYLQRAVLTLAKLYEQSTGKRFTHNPKEKTGYKGEPHSPGGLFILVFFAIVDPTVRQQSISTAMARIVKSRGTIKKSTAG
jgi:hypothetical protein